MAFSKPLRMARSLLVLFIGVGLLSMGLQMFVMEKLNNESLLSYQEALIESRTIETASFARVVRNDLDAFRSQIYALYSSLQFKRLKTTMAEGQVSSRYFQDCLHMWSELKMRLFDNPLFSEISMYMVESGRKVTTGSVVKNQEAENELLKIITAHSNSAAMIGDSLYIWVPQIYDKNRSAEHMGCITVGTVTGDTAGRYLQRFGTEASGASLLILYADENGIRPLSHPGSPEQAERLIAGAGIGTACMNGHTVLKDGGQSLLMTWAQIDNLPLVFCEWRPMGPLDGRMSLFSSHLTVYHVLVLTVTLLLMAMLYLLVRSPLRKLRMALRAIEKGELDKRLPKSRISDFQYVNEQFNAMGARLEDLVEREYTLRLLHIKAELRQLQYQINPHFLYNTYFTLQALLEEEETEKASAFAGMLGRYLKYTTSSDREYATLGEEIMHAKNYAEIQQMRFSQQVDLQWRIQAERYQDLKVPKLILQPLIENAFEHGIRRMLEGGIIRVSLEETDGAVICVEDNGQNLTDERLEALETRLRQNSPKEGEDSVALLNIHRRLQILFGPQSGLSVSRSELQGMKVTVTIRGEMIDV